MKIHKRKFYWVDRNGGFDLYYWKCLVSTNNGSEDIFELSLGKNNPNNFNAIWKQDPEIDNNITAPDLTYTLSDGSTLKPLDGDVKYQLENGDSFSLTKYEVVNDEYNKGY